MIAALSTFLFLGVATGQAAQAPDIQLSGVMFEDVRIFDSTSDRLSSPSNVLVAGNLIKAISTRPIPTSPAMPLIRIQGGGRTLMQGLIDAHTHLMFATVPQQVALMSDTGFLHVAANQGGDRHADERFHERPRRGRTKLWTQTRHRHGLGGRTARIWPSGAFISQTGGHADFRLPNELPATPGSFSFSKRIGAAAIADGPDAVRQRAREQLALGASQIKLMAGSGVASPYDPLDVTQYTVAELRAAVEAAENWGAYVTVHAYTPRSVRQAIEAGVRCIDHGHLLDEATATI